MGGLLNVVDIGQVQFRQAALRSITSVLALMKVLECERSLRGGIGLGVGHLYWQFNLYYMLVIGNWTAMHNAHHTISHSVYSEAGLCNLIAPFADSPDALPQTAAILLEWRCIKDRGHRAGRPTPCSTRKGCTARYRPVDTLEPTGSATVTRGTCLRPVS